MKSLNILYVAYPLLTVSAESAGGAEQVLWNLEREMARRGVHTTVAASSGSIISGELLPTGNPCAQLDDFERRNREHQEKTITFIRRHSRSFDLVHDMSGSFWTRAAEADLPVLATLHLPRGFYPARSFEDLAPNVSFNCVSNSQALSFTGLKNMLGVVPNGIALDRFLQQDDTASRRPREGLLWLGRICEEKAPHLALEIAACAGLPITLAGQVYPFSYHQQYFEKEIVPRLRQTPGAVFVDSPSFQQKRDLLRQAQALLITSQVAETSSLVAMEASASGTPVIAYRRGALPEVVQDETTGFLIDSIEEAATACRRLASISSQACFNYARENFHSANMADGYAQLYCRVISMSAATAAQALNVL
jgi:glycosyltransferase involved in cell wall biosynthesis